MISRHSSRRDFHATANRRAAVEETIDKRLIDDDHRRGAGQEIVGRERPARHRAASDALEKAVAHLCRWRRAGQCLRLAVERFDHDRHRGGIETRQMAGGAGRHDPWKRANRGQQAIAGLLRFLAAQPRREYLSFRQCRNVVDVRRQRARRHQRTVQQRDRERNLHHQDTAHAAKAAGRRSAAMRMQHAIQIHARDLERRRQPAHDADQKGHAPPRTPSSGSWDRTSSRTGCRCRSSRPHS